MADKPSADMTRMSCGASATDPLRHAEKCIACKQALVDALGARVSELGKKKARAFSERNHLVALLARVVLSSGGRAGRRTHEDVPGEDWDPEWRTLVSIDLPTGQVSWHFHDTDAHLAETLPEYHGAWDGHDTSEKYRRVDACKWVSPHSDSERLFTLHKLSELQSVRLLQLVSECERLAKLAGIADYRAPSLDGTAAGEKDARIAELERHWDCGQEGVCAIAPGCVKHFAELNRELVRERDAAPAKVAELESLPDNRAALGEASRINLEAAEEKLADRARYDEDVRRVAVSAKDCSILLGVYRAAGRLLAAPYWKGGK